MKKSPLPASNKTEPINLPASFIKNRYQRITLINKNKSDSFYFNIQDIAVIGVAGRYPQAATIEDYWKNLSTGKNCIAEIPEDRFGW